MLVDEGLGYAVITLFFVFTAGSTITFGIFKLFQQQVTYAIFTYPFISVLMASLVVLAICIMTPFPLEPSKIFNLKISYV